MDARPLASGAEEFEDIFGVVRENVPRRTAHITALSLCRDDSGAVTVNQSTQERLDLSGYESLLPVREDDPAGVLPAGAVLREETRPMFPVVRYLGASSVGPLVNASTSARRYRLDRCCALGDYPGVSGVEGDPKLVDPAQVI